MRHRILVVDDDPAARHGLKRALAALSCEVVEAADGAAALDEIARSGPDLLICDIQMPRMDGLTLVKRLDEHGDAPPVIMMTAYGSERIAVEAMKAGAYDYVSKPYEVDELRCLVPECAGDGSPAKGERNVAQRDSPSVRVRVADRPEPGHGAGLRA